MKNILITGGAGFIGSHVVRLFVNKYPNYRIINFDCLTYAGNLGNITDVSLKNNYEFFYGNICKKEDIIKAFETYNITDVIHLAAESHVDRSIDSPDIFFKTNVEGTINLLNACKKFWEGEYEKHRFHHVSTDEVYGALDMNPENKFKETTPYNPHSPYSASKASSDHFVKAYHDTYGLNVTISNCSNNYGPNQFPEKLIPLAINNLRNNKKIPVYGKGENVRDWLYVEDHAKAIDTIFHNGINGETYNVGGNHEMKNIEIIETILKAYEDIALDKFVPMHEINEEYSYTPIEKVIEYVTDRKGHDLRYAIDSTKLQNELGWKPEETFESGIRKTVEWYIENEEWFNNVTSGEYQNYYTKMYKKGED